MALKKVFIVFIFVMNLFLTEPLLVKIWDKYHFTELVVNGPIDIESTREAPLEQTFDYMIKGNGTCAQRANKRISDHYSTSDRLGLDAKVVIYPDEEDTLSWMIQFKFSSQREFSAYEIVLERNNVTSSCIQIMLSNNQKHSKEFKLTIKDPWFLNHDHSQYVFYFSKAYIRPLVPCEIDSDVRYQSDRSLCAVDGLGSSRVDIGLKSALEDGQAIRKDYDADTCAGYLTSQTCIIRYDPYYIILSPMTEDFEYQAADLDIANAQDDDIKLINEARNKGHRWVMIRNMNYSLAYRESDKSDKRIHNIYIYNRQKTLNGVVLKLVSYSHHVHYVAELYNPTSSNKCNQTLSPREAMCYCATDGSCKPCYRIEKDKMKGKGSHLDLIGSNDNRSPTCNDDFYRQFDFSKTITTIKFQNQLIFNKLLTTKNTVDYLPSLCISASYASNLTSLHNVRMILNDDRRVARTSLIETTYRIALFKIDLPPTNESSLSSSRSQIDSSRLLLDVKTSLIMNTTSSIQLSDLVEFHNVKPGVYLVELTPIEKSDLCEANKCVYEKREGGIKNIYECGECRKTVTVFGLSPLPTPKKANQEENQESTEIKSDSPWCALNKLTIDVSVYSSSQRGSLLSKEHTPFKCASLTSDLFDFDNEKQQLEFITSSSGKKQDAVLDQNPSIMMPKDMDVGRLRFSMRFLKAIESNLLAASAVEYSLEHLCKNYLAQMYVLMIIGVLFIASSIILSFLFLSWTYLSHNGPFSASITVLFYMSMFVNQEDQKSLSLFVLSFVNELKEKFHRAKFILIDFSTENRAQKIENADIVFYVGAGGLLDRELTYFSKSFELIGTNKYHDDLYKLRNHKCIRLVRFMPKNTSNAESSRDQDENQPLVLTSTTTTTATDLPPKFELPQQTFDLIREILSYSRVESSPQVRSGIQNEEFSRNYAGQFFKRLLIGPITKLNTNSLRRSLDGVYRFAIRNDSPMFAFDLTSFNALYSSNYVASVEQTEQLEFC